MSIEGGVVDAVVGVWVVLAVEGVGVDAEIGGSDAVVDPAARGSDGPGGFTQRSTAAIAAAVTRASIRSSGAFDGVMLVLADDVAGIVEVVVDPGEAALSPSVTLAFDCEAVADVVGVV